MVLLTLLHLGDQVLVEQATGLLVQGAVDGNNVTLSKHLLEGVNTTAADFLLNLGTKGLVVVVEKLLAVKWLEATKDTLTNTADSNGSDDLALQIEFILSDSGNVPLTAGDLLVSGDKVTDQSKDGHDNVFRNRGDITASYFSDSDTAISLVGGVQVNVIRSDTSSDCDLEVFGLGQALSGKIAGVEATAHD